MKFTSWAILTGIMSFCPAWLSAEQWRSSYSLYGTPGIIEMPSASVRPDAELAFTLGGFETQQRLSFGFQVTPRFSGTFRYSRIDEFGGVGRGPLYDRSFDLHYQLLPETGARPAIAVGLRDFMGTGIYTGEYLVATKTFGSNLSVTTGLGWGRLATEGGFDNPLSAISSAFSTRPDLDFGKGGRPSWDQFFRGDAALLAGAEWQMTDDIRALIEYSSDGYRSETANGTVERNTPINIGAVYAPSPYYQLGAYYLGGSEVALAGTLILNPLSANAGNGREPAPPALWGNGRLASTTAAQVLDGATAGYDTDVIARQLGAEGISLLGIVATGQTAQINFENQQYRTEAQALGRVARIVSNLMPRTIVRFALVPHRNGIPLSQVVIGRDILEENETRADGAARVLSGAQIGESMTPSLSGNAQSQTADFEWGITPYVAAQVFDGSNPLRLEYGLQADAIYEIAPNILVNGRARYRAGSDREGARISDSPLHPVRRNVSEYGEVGTIGLEHLTISHYGRPAVSWYSRATVGYLEQMFAGVSAEVLWKPVDSNLALGAEMNYVVQRDYDLGFGAQYFSDIDGYYTVATGHVSAYYDFENDFHARLDVGRYLAGDWGATFQLDREFANGWRVGAYATLTDVAFEDFGEGSFDKGIRLAVPLDWATGSATRRSASLTLASLSRDGGARLDVDGRLYENVREGHRSALTESWGRFWR